MRRSVWVSVLMCLCAFILGSGELHGQSSGAIAAWGYNSSGQHGPFEIGGHVFLSHAAILPLFFVLVIKSCNSTPGGEIAKIVGENCLQVKNSDP